MQLDRASPAPSTECCRFLGEQVSGLCELDDVPAEVFVSPGITIARYPCMAFPSGVSRQVFKTCAIVLGSRSSQAAPAPRLSLCIPWANDAGINFRTAAHCASI